MKACLGIKFLNPAGYRKNRKRYYAQVRMIGPDGSSKPRRVSLGVVHLDVARAELERVRTENRSGALIAGLHAQINQKFKIPPEMIEHGFRNN